MKSLVLDAFRKTLTHQPDRTALLDLSSGRRLSFKNLDAEFRAVRNVFDRVVPPERSLVISVVGNDPVWFSVFLATFARGDILMPLDPDTTWAEVDRLALRYGASAIVAPAGDRPEQSLPLPGGLGLYPRVRAESVDLGDAALLKLTSGTSEEPKAVLVSEENLWNDGRHIVDAVGIDRDDVNYGVIPLSHSYGLGNLVMPLFLQGTAVALRDRFLPAKVQGDVRMSRATVFPGVPFHFARILAQTSGPLPESLRTLLSAGARLDPKLAARFLDRLRRKIHSFYGSSETGGITYDDSEEVQDPLHVGTAMPETEVSLTSSEGRVFVRGNAVARGYALGDEGSSDSEFVDGGFLTGDLGERDTLGRLILAGRVSTFVNVAGRKVNPREVESVLLAMPEISEAKVLGVPCEHRGQKLVAFVVPRASRLSAVDVRTYCAERLSPHKIPRELLLLESLPLNPRGKVDRQALEELAR